MMLTTTGAKTGQARTCPVLGIPFGEDYGLQSGNFGVTSVPSWVHNLRAHPDVAVQDGTEHHAGLRARLAEGPEREEWWERSVAAFPPYAEYQEKTDRQIPVYLLEPVKPA